MNAQHRRLVLILAIALVVLPSAFPLFGPSATMQQAAQSQRPIELQDIVDWKAIGTTAVSTTGSGLRIASHQARAMRRSW